MKSKSKQPAQSSMFDMEPIAKQQPKHYSSTKKVVVNTSYEINRGETGLNSVWRNFGDFIENGRNNKTI